MRRDFASIATAGWNTFAEISNIISTINNLGGALADAGDLFSIALDSEGVKSKIAGVLIVCCILSLLLGYVLAISMVKYFAKQSESRIEQYAQILKA